MREKSVKKKVNARDLEIINSHCGILKLFDIYLERLDIDYGLMTFAEQIKIEKEIDAEFYNILRPYVANLLPHVKVIV